MLKTYGTIINIGNIEEVGREKRPKVDITIEDKETGNSFCITFFGFENVQYTKALNIGDYGRFLFSLKTKEYDGKYYNGLNIFKFNIKKKAEKPNNDLPF